MTCTFGWSGCRLVERSFVLVTTIGSRADGHEEDVELTEVGVLQGVGGLEEVLSRRAEKDQRERLSSRRAWAGRVRDDIGERQLAHFVACCADHRERRVDVALERSGYGFVSHRAREYSRLSTSAR